MYIICIQLFNNPPYIQKELKDAKQSKMDTQQELKNQTERLEVRDATFCMVTITIVMHGKSMYAVLEMMVGHQTLSNHFDHFSDPKVFGSDIWLSKIKY